jgi:adenylylsulfate kinase-like enzyme
MIIWFYGQPGSGKTTLAKELMTSIDAIHIDGDEIREVFQNKDYSKEGRMKNLTLINNIVRFLDYKNNNVIVSVVAPFKEVRDQILDLNTKYFYVHTSKIRGREQNFAQDFEITESDVKLDTTNKTIKEVIDEVLNVCR